MVSDRVWLVICGGPIHFNVFNRFQVWALCRPVKFFYNTEELSVITDLYWNRKPVNLKEVSTLAIQCMRQNVFDYCFGSLVCKAVTAIPRSEGFCHATLLLVGKSSLLVDKLNYHATEKCISFELRFIYYHYPL